MESQPRIEDAGDGEARPASAAAAAGKRRFYTELESLRGVAALMVVIFHVYGGKQPDTQTLSHLDFTAVANLILTTLFSGTGAVSLFFVLSGFVLGESLKRVPELDASSYLEFVVKRGFRLLPVAWASIFFAIATYKYRHIAIEWHLLKPALLLQESGYSFFNGPLWSLNVEMWASLLFPVLAFANRLMSAPFQIVPLVVLLWLSSADGFPFWTMYFFCFQFGLMIRPVFVPAIERMSDRVAAVLFVFAVLTVIVPTNLSLLGYLTSREHGQIEGFGATFVVAYLLAPPGAWLARHLNMPPLRFLGRISYSLYAFHYPLVSLFDVWTWDHIAAQPYLVAQSAALLTVVPACLLAGTVGYYLIEAPCLRLGRHIATVFRPRAAVQLAPAE